MSSLEERAMAMMIDLAPELESRLQEEAARRGLGVSEYTSRLIEQSLPAQEGTSKSLWYALTPEEWIREATEWAQSHDTSIPLLSEEAVSRESFYEGRP
jgi:hypothetical protein